MQIQFDPFSFAVAVIAVLVSLRAYVLSKRAPHVERVRQNRDVVRSALRDLADVFRDLRHELDEGREVGEVPSEIDAAYSVLEEYGPRLPERSHVWQIQSSIRELQSAWRSAISSAERVRGMDQEVTLWETEIASSNYPEKTRALMRRNLSEARRRQAEMRRVLDTSLTNLRAAVDPAEVASGDYVSRIDAEERGAAK
ncbi:hypothetical protein D8M34_05910 [Microbacterium sp. HSID17254]|uniref:hypothetical protein n=1 Tax=Microbacterium sp. HSID17254 TaxID=2419509 RepID=UPI000F85E42C|nr:hypothetical protein [Microbacterium sp. HSID17254]RUQ07004.1 hypothetical protein D8M34_05910 [Microbacterium sp. HSID17254]